MNWSFLKLKRANKSEHTEVFFVRGFPRSGTNWIGNLLNLHPDISINGEFHLEEIDRAIQQFTSQYRWTNLTETDAQRDAFLKYYYQFIHNLIKHNNKPVSKVGDRTPSKINSLLLPGHKYIVISRDGRDALVSWMYHILRIKIPASQKSEETKLRVLQFEKDDQYFEKNPHQLLPTESFVRSRARQWNRHILSDMEMCMEKKNRDVQFKHLWLTYEALLEDTESLRNKMYDFLGVDGWKARNLNERTSPGFSKNNVQSHYRSGTKNSWLKYFTVEQAQWFDDEANEALSALGYQSTVDMLNDFLNNSET